MPCFLLSFPQGTWTLKYNRELICCTKENMDLINETHHYALKQMEALVFFGFAPVLCVLVSVCKWKGFKPFREEQTREISPALRNSSFDDAGAHLDCKGENPALPPYKKHCQDYLNLLLKSIFIFSALFLRLWKLSCFPNANLKYFVRNDYV